MDRVLQRLSVGILVGYAGNQVPGGEDELIHGGRHGHDVAVPVVYLAPLCGDELLQGPLVGGHLLILVVVDDGDVPQLPDQGDEHREAADPHQEQGAAEDGPLGVCAPGPRHRGQASPARLTGRFLSHVKTLLSGKGRKKISFLRPLSLLGPPPTLPRGSFYLSESPYMPGEFVRCDPPALPRYAIRRPFLGHALTIWPAQRKYSMIPLKRFCIPLTRD